jgi:hypothetical protein
VRQHFFYSQAIQQSVSWQIFSISRALAIIFGLKLVSRTSYDRLNPGTSEQQLERPISSILRFLACDVD